MALGRAFGTWGAALSTHKTIKEPHLGAIGASQGLQLWLGQPWWPRGAGQLLGTAPAHTPAFATIWPLCAPLVAANRYCTTWGPDLCTIGASQQPLLWAGQPWWPQEPGVPSATCSPRVATHCHLALVRPTGGSNQR